MDLSRAIACRVDGAEGEIVRCVLENLEPLGLAYGAAGRQVEFTSF
jgi:hypothetical protein